MAYKRKTSFNNTKMQKMQKKALFIALAAAFLFLSLNKEGRNMIKAYFKEKTLLENIEKAQKEKILLENKLHLLENDPLYFEKIVREKLGVISAGEIEYRILIRNKEIKKENLQ